MVKYCAALGCHESHKNNSDLQFYRFPISRPDVLKKWQNAVGRKNWKPTIHSILCGKHFTPNSYKLIPGAAVKRLKEDAVPSIFNFPIQPQREVGKQQKVSNEASTSNVHTSNEHSYADSPLINVESEISVSSKYVQDDMPVEKKLKELNSVIEMDADSTNNDYVVNSTTDLNLVTSKSLKGNVNVNESENCDIEAVFIKTDMDSYNDTYIIVVGDGNDDRLNANNINDRGIKNDMDYDTARMELFSKPSVNNNCICRLCMSCDDNSCEKLLPLFNKSTKLKFIDDNIVSVLDCLTGLKVTEDDELPKYICKVCLSRLEICWAFQQQCLKSDKVMRELNQASKNFCKLSNTATSGVRNLTSNQVINDSRISQNTGDYSDDEMEESERISLGEDDGLVKVKNFLDTTPSELKTVKCLKNPLHKLNKRKEETQSQPPKTKLLLPYNESCLNKKSGIMLTCCDICGWNGNSAKDLHEHRKSHLLNDHPFSCQLCQRLFKTEGALTSHVKNTHNVNLPHYDRSVNCSVCHTFVNKNLISDHYLMHKCEKMKK